MGSTPIGSTNKGRVMATITKISLWSTCVIAQIWPNWCLILKAKSLRIIHKLSVVDVVELVYQGFRKDDSGESTWSVSSNLTINEGYWNPWNCSHLWVVGEHRNGMYLTVMLWEDNHGWCIKMESWLFSLKKLSAKYSLQFQNPISNGRRVVPLGKEAWSSNQRFIYYNTNKFPARVYELLA